MNQKIYEARCPHCDTLLLRGLMTKKTYGEISLDNLTPRKSAKITNINAGVILHFPEQYDDSELVTISYNFDMDVTCKKCGAANKRLIYNSLYEHV